MQTRSCSSQPQDDLQCFMRLSVHTLVSRGFAGLTEGIVHAFGGQVIKDFVTSASLSWRAHAGGSQLVCLKILNCWEAHVMRSWGFPPTAGTGLPAMWMNRRQQLLQPQTSLQLTEAQTATFTPTTGWARTSQLSWFRIPDPRELQYNTPLF